MSGQDVSDMTERKVRYDSSTGVGGITRHADGVGFLVRVTKDGERIYLGYFTDFEKAKTEIEKWKAQQKS